MPSSTLRVLLISLPLLFCSTLVNGRGYFWHVTDLHLDQNYSRTGNPAAMCHETGSGVADAGLYGNFLCDSPYYLVNVTIHSMKLLQSNPDFIVWTGDNLPHTKNPDPDWTVILSGIKNITSLLTANFPGVPIVTCIGNHDTFPPDGFPNDSLPVYNGYLHKGGWDALLNEESQITFRQGGFYSQVVKPGLRIVSLNTILWYTPNEATAEVADPSKQFEWLDELLRNSSKNSEKVYLIGHVPPGYYNRAPPGSRSDSTYHPRHHVTYLQILHKYHKTIIGQLYGHLHMDLFQIFQFDTHSFLSSSLLGSSVTPWHHPDALEVDVPVNPAVRLVHYSQSSYKLLDYDQFYLNLSKANNQSNKNEGAKILYELLYTFTKAYKVRDLSTESLVEVYDKLKNHQPTFDMFYHFLTAGKDTFPCDSDCKVVQLCAMASISINEYDSCMNGIDSNEISVEQEGGASVQTLTVAVSVIVPVVLLLCIGFVVFNRVRKQRHGREYEPFLQF